MSHRRGPTAALVWPHVFPAAPAVTGVPHARPSPPAQHAPGRGRRPARRRRRGRHRRRSPSSSAGLTAVAAVLAVLARCRRHPHHALRADADPPRRRARPRRAGPGVPRPHRAAYGRVRGLRRRHAPQDRSSARKPSTCSSAPCRRRRRTPPSRPSSAARRPVVPTLPTPAARPPSAVATRPRPAPPRRSSIVAELEAEIDVAARRARLAARRCRAPQPPQRLTHLARPRERWLSHVPAPGLGCHALLSGSRR